MNPGMLGVARQKAARNDVKNVVFEKGNALGLKYRTAYFDAVVCSFALKNFDSQKRFLKELRSYYEEWEILHYNEYLTDWEQHDNLKPHRHFIADIIARKYSA